MSNQLTFSFSPPPLDAPVDLSEFYQTCKLLERLSSVTQDKIILRITKSGAPENPFEYRISNPTVSLPNETREFINLLKSIWLVSRNLDLDQHTAISVRELSSMRPAIFLLESVFGKLMVRAGCEIPVDISADHKSAIVTFPVLRFGRRDYVFSVAIVGIPQMQVRSGTTSVTIESSDTRILQRWALSYDRSKDFAYDRAAESAGCLLNEVGIENVFFVHDLTKPGLNYP